MSKVQFWIAVPTGEDHMYFDAEIIGNLVRSAANTDAGYDALALSKEEAAAVDPSLTNEPHTFFTITVEEVPTIGANETYDAGPR